MTDKSFDPEALKREFLQMKASEPITKEETKRNDDSELKGLKDLKEQLDMLSGKIQEQDPIKMEHIDLTDADVDAVTKQALIELESLRKQWLEFQYAAKEMSIYPVVEAAICALTDGFITMEKALRAPEGNVDVKENMQRLRTKAQLLSAILKKNE